MTLRHHREVHYSKRTGWLRAAVLGANDGIVSTASLVLGVAAADAARSDVLLAGVAGLVAGALSMAAGEYVSVSSQADTERADLDRERQELAENPESERRELANIYMGRGLDRTLAFQVADQLSQKDPLAAHARDELGLTTVNKAQPVQAALASAGSFAIGAVLPLLTTLFSPLQLAIPVTAGSSLLSLGILGYVAAVAGGSRVPHSVARVTLWGALAMLLTAAVGKLFGIAA